MTPLKRDGVELSHYLPGSRRANRLDGYRLRIGKIMTLKVERHIDQRNHHRHLHQRPDDRREGGAGVDAKYRHCHRNRQFEVVAGGGEGRAWWSWNSPPRPSCPCQKDTRNISTK